MAWLQENYVIAVVGLVVAIVLLWFLFGRKKAEDVTPTVAPTAEPKKPLEAVKPEIVAAEPARFKPKEPAPAAAPPTPPPAPEPVVERAPEPDIPEQPAAAPPEAPAELPPAAEAEAEPACAPEPAPAPEPTPAPDPALAPEPEPEPAPTPAPAPEPAPAPAPAPVAKTDNLQLIKGLGPKLAGLLNGLGVTSFQQIADWTEADIAAIDPQLGAFQGRIARDNFVDQAGYLARGDKAGFEAKYGALGGEL